MKKKQKQKSTKELVRRALRNKPKWKPRKGYVYLATIKPEGMFRLSNGTEGIHLESSGSSSKVIVVSCPHANSEEDKRYYLGMQKWSTYTEVKRIK